MLNCQKDQFFIEPPVVYLNGAYMSPQLRSVQTAGIQSLKRKNQPWNIRPTDFFSDVQQLKQLFAKLIHSNQSERVAIIPSVSYGITNAARNIHFTPGDRIVILEKQFPSNYYIWHELARKHQLDLKVVPIPNQWRDRGKTWNQQLIQSITARTKLVSIEQVHWTDGTRFDLIEVNNRVKEVGALLIVDATQSLGILDFDQTQIKADAIVAASYKWLLGPYAIGCAYYGEAFDQGLPMEENWMNKKGSEIFEQLLKYEPEFKPAATRYNMGEQSQFIQVPMLCAALNQIMNWGIDHMQAYCKSLVDPILPDLATHGLWIEDPSYRSNHLFGLRSAKGFKPALKQNLIDQNIFVSYRDDAIRVSPNVYNTPDDLNLLLDAIVKSI